MDTKYIVSRLAPFFKENGYKKKSSLFYKIQNNIAYCIGFERPGDLRAVFHILPLYTPLEFKELTYGSHLEYFPKCKVPSISPLENIEDFKRKYPNSLNLNNIDDCEIWIDKIVQCCEQHIFPFYDRIGTLNGLMDFLNMGHYHVYQYWNHCGLAQYYEIRAYTNFVLSQYKAMEKDIKKAKEAIDDMRIFPHLKDESKNNLDAFSKMSKATDEEKQRFIDATVASSLAACFGKHH